MKVFKNIERSTNYKTELSRVMNDLIPLRGNREATVNYYENYLETDVKYKIWREDKRECKLNNNLHLNPQYQEFKLLSGAIDPKEARAFRRELLYAISDDKYSFGYLYHLLGSEENREASDVLYECVISDDKVKYAIKFDIDEVIKEIESVDEPMERFTLVMKWKRESDRTEYAGKLKNAFNVCMNGYLEEIERGKQLFGYTQPKLEHSEPKQSMPKESDTDERKMDVNIQHDQEEENCIYSESLLHIFKGDTKRLNTFLDRIKFKKGSKVVIEVQALIKLGLIREDFKGRSLYLEISKIQNIGTESNWNSAFGNKHNLAVSDAESYYK